MARSTRALTHLAAITALAELIQGEGPIGQLRTIVLRYHPSLKSAVDLIIAPPPGMGTVARDQMVIEPVATPEFADDEWGMFFQFRCMRCQELLDMGLSEDGRSVQSACGLRFLDTRGRSIGMWEPVGPGSRT